MSVQGYAKGKPASRYEGRIEDSGTFLQRCEDNRMNVTMLFHVFKNDDKKTTGFIAANGVLADIDDNADQAVFDIEPSVRVWREGKNGCHAAWLFQEPLPMKAPEASKTLDELAFSLTQGLCERGFGAKLTNGMRIPFTYNHKGDPDPYFVEYNTDEEGNLLTYSVEDLQPALQEWPLELASFEDDVKKFTKGSRNNAFLSAAKTLFLLQLNAGKEPTIEQAITIACRHLSQEEDDAETLYRQTAMNALRYAKGSQDEKIEAIQNLSDEVIMFRHNDPYKVRMDGLLNALSRRDDVFVIDGDTAKPQLAQVIVDKRQILPMTEAMLKMCLSGHVVYLNKKEEIVSTDVQGNDGNDALSLRIFPQFRNLEGFADYPLLRHDGSVITDGYDEDLCYLVRMDKDRKTREFHNVPLALDFLRDFVGDFAFADLESEAVWFSALFSTLFRQLIKGPTPLHVFDANEAGAGKTTLAKMVGAIVFGQPTATMDAQMSSDETVKMMVSLLSEKQKCILLDNVQNTFGAAIIDNLLTSETFSARRLGQNMSVTVKNNATWMLTGNNVELKDDTHRRSLVCRINKIDLTGVKYPRLIEACLQQRHAIIDACIVIMQEWLKHGIHKDHNTSLFESYSDTTYSYSDVVRRLLISIGLGDVTKRKGVTVAGNDSVLLSNRVVEKLSSFDGLCTGQDILKKASNDLVFKDLLEDLCGRPFMQINSMILGKKLIKLVERRTPYGKLKTVKKNNQNNFVVVPYDDESQEVTEQE